MLSIILICKWRPSKAPPSSAMSDMTAYRIVKDTAPFWRRSAATAKRDGGVPVGLWIVNGLTEIAARD